MKIRAPDDEGIQAENMKNETDDSSTKVWQDMLFRLIVSRQPSDVNMKWKLTIYPVEVALN